MQKVLNEILTVIYETEFLDCSYGFRPGRSCHDALKEVAKILEKEKINYVVDAEAFYGKLVERLGKFNLKIAEEKTKIIEFERFKKRLKNNLVSRRGNPVNIGQNNLHISPNYIILLRYLYISGKVLKWLTSQIIVAEVIMEINGLIMHQFFQLTRSISQSLNSHFSPYNLHFSEWGIILTLMGKGPMTQRDLASYLNVEPSAVSRSLVRLQNKGYIMRKVGVDRRERQASLTELAKKQYQLWDSIAGQHRQNLLADLTEEKKKELYTVLSAIYQQCKEDGNI